MLASWMVYLAALLIVLGAAQYIYEIYRGQVRPNLVTWLIWSLAPLIALAAQLGAGVGEEAILTAAVGLCPLAVFLAGLKKGSFKPQKFDWWCGGMSLVALVLWQVTGNGAIGIILSIVADALGAAPTLRKSYLHPQSESPTFFMLFAISAALTLGTITEWTVQNVAFSVYILVLYTILFVFVRFRPGAYLQRTTPSSNVPIDDTSITL